MGVLLASKMASGVGLNLTAANHVVVADPWWNPAVEEQAVGRAHRIGQTKEVFVHRCVTKGSVEGLCVGIAARKRVVGEGVLRGAMGGGGGGEGGGGGGVEGGEKDGAGDSVS